MLIDTVRETIEKNGLIRPGDNIVLGLSGGPDSVCLFDILRRLSGEYDLKLFPVHVNHMLRPGDAERDQRYVEELCESAGLPCRIFTVDCAAMARELGKTSEEAGRIARYDAFRQTAELVMQRQAGSPQSSCGEPLPVRIAVAQNANDQAETILHRIIRGTGTDGLAGIAYQRYEKGIPVIRPLLDVPRKEIEEYCEEHGLRPVIDHTNLQPVYTRNRIRLELLPELEKINPNIIESLARLGRIAASDKAYLWQETERVMQGLYAEPESAAEAEAKSGTESEPAPVVLDRARLAALPDAIRRRVILKCFAGIGLDADISEERLRAADSVIAKKQAPKSVQFPRGYCLTVRQGKVIFHRSV